jgi:hypothetical protein
MRKSDDHATLTMAWTALGLPAMRLVQIAEARDRLCPQLVNATRG